MNSLLTYQDIQKVTSGHWLTEPSDFSKPLYAAAFDSRDLAGAEIFFTLPGERDAHQFLPKLAGSSIRLVLVTQEVPPIEGAAILMVADALKALHDLARFQSKRFQGKIIALTGSSGKTTAKSWLLHLLLPYFKVIANQGSFNNHIGCPLTILGIKQDTEILILEMGTNGMGELELLSDIAPADYTLLLNVGHAHVGMFGSLENTYLAKMEIFSQQRPGGLAILPAEDPKLMELSQGLHRSTFGREDGNYRYELLDQQPNLQRIRLSRPKGTREFEVKLAGQHVPITLSALMVILDDLGIWEKLPEQLKLPIEKGRGVLLQSGAGATLYDDTYNANPESLVNMLQSLMRIPGGLHLAVIGNMGELDDGLMDSAQVILEGIPKDLDQLFLIGQTGQTLAPLIQEAHPQILVRYFETLRSLIEEVRKLDQEGAVIGVKGSRSSHMERVILALQGRNILCLQPYCGHLMMCSACRDSSPDE